MIQDNLVIAHHSFCFRLYRGRLLLPAEIIDLLKGFVIGICVYVMSYIDTSMMYHLIKSQSVIKLYLFYNMLEASAKTSTIFSHFFSLQETGCNFQYLWKVIIFKRILCMHERCWYTACYNKDVILCRRSSKLIVLPISLLYL